MCVIRLKLRCLGFCCLFHTWHDNVAELFFCFFLFSPPPTPPPPTPFFPPFFILCSCPIAESASLQRNQMMLTPKQNPRWCLERWPKDPSIQMQKGWFLFLSAIQNVLLFVCCCFFSFFLSASLFLFTFFLCFLPCFFCYVFHSIIYVFSLLFLPICLIIYLKKILNRHKMRH